MLVAAAALLLAACPGNSGAYHPKADGKVSVTPGPTDDPTPTTPKADGGAAIPAVDGSPAVTADSGAAATGNLSCSQIEDCYMTCGDTDDACFDACYNKGSAAGQAQADALDNCEYTAYDGACKSKCTTDNQTCWDCCDGQCTAQINACL